MLLALWGDPEIILFIDSTYVIEWSELCGVCITYSIVLLYRGVAARELWYLKVEESMKNKIWWNELMEQEMVIASYVTCGVAL